MMRIITGRARGVRLDTLEGEATRPTSERAKEAVFSMLQFELQGKNVLDLFAGSGQLGLEAVSRGAAHATLADSSRAAVDILRKNALKTKLAPDCDILCSDYASVLQMMRRKRQFGLVFLDPPYALGLLPSALEGLLKNRLLSPEAKIVCESASPDDVFSGDDALAEHFVLLRVSRYGMAYITVLQYRQKEEENNESCNRTGQL